MNVNECTIPTDFKISMHFITTLPHILLKEIFIKKKQIDLEETSK